jgi:hypothetical protein
MRAEDFKKLGEMLVQATTERPIQYNIGSAAEPRWCDGHAGLEFNLPIDFYRIKPAAKLRAWRFSEVPISPDVWFRNKHSGVWWRITYVNPSGEHSVAARDGKQKSAAVLMHEHEHSLDNGKTWLPCGVLETEAKP